MKSYKVGDQVSLLDDALNGTVSEIEGQRAFVKLDDGFEEWVSFHKLVHKKKLQLDIDPLHEKHSESHIEIRAERVYEIDLHIEHLVIDWKKIPTDKILDRQITSFTEELKDAIQNKYDKLIVIHGKGKGILKTELINILQSKGLNFSEMGYGKYKGAALKIRLT